MPERAVLPERSAPALAVGRSTVIGRRELAPEVHLLSFSAGASFLPGQNVNLSLSPSGPARSYSVASGAGEPLMEVLFDLVPGGLLTPRLAALRAGDPLYVSPPFGGFLDDERPSTWIAAGTGVAPFASMVRSGLGPDKILVQAARTPEGLHFRELFAARLGSRYFPCCPGEAAGDGVRGEGLRAWLRENELPPGRRYLLCGSARMVVEVREQLIARGVPFGNIVAEIYF
jgi:ferredoxin--NADP+ reductase